MRTIKVTLMTFLITVIFTHSCNNPANLSLRQLEETIFSLVNQHRASKGQNKLNWNETIAEQCRIHSSNMAQNRVEFGHQGFEDRVAAIEKEIPLTRAGENIAYIYNHIDPAQTAFNRWLSNTDHLNNIEGDFDCTGVGVKTDSNEIYYFTQIFIKTKNEGESL